ncbi:hypothetical protein HELRODRAFT_185119 [Helobdella robusta]|uniref:Septin-type G domain-containing protein n=1 Tax=Helobdella robusta TaxID=6412 RepID=T1FMF2_HELRO|nr:hypothetical protein HELRODRAFT_185119 [Helobdella robusta]ESN94549.1 hypothetical protein HELRODRAFT_185119 [Helobdella robusta]
MLPFRIINGLTILLMSNEIQSYISSSSGGKNRLPVPKKSFRSLYNQDRTALSPTPSNTSVHANSELSDHRSDSSSSLTTDSAPIDSRKEAREAFLKSEPLGLTKKYEGLSVRDSDLPPPTATNHHDLPNGAQKTTASSSITSNGTAPSTTSFIPPSANQISSSSKLRLQKEPDTYVGFANLPNQVYRKSVKKGFEFTLMLVGESGLGKSTLINSMFLTDIYNNEHPGPSKRPNKTLKVEKMNVLLKEGGVQLKLTIVDTPGFGDAVNNSNCWQPVVEYIDSQYNAFLNAESRVIRQVSEDTRVHCCLYFISPNGHGLRQLDIEFMKQLHEKVNIIPLIAKADSMTAEECKTFKKTIMNEIMQNKIKIYEFPDCDDEEERRIMKKMKERIPFAVVGSNMVVECNGRKIRARTYPWGVVEVENLEHNDFTALRNMLIRTHLHDLKDVTNNVHYENFRYEHLLASVSSDGKSKPMLNKSPMLQIEEEKMEHAEKLKKMEMEMEMVFEAKVKEKQNKIKESDADVGKRRDQMLKSLKQEEMELEEMREAFVRERDAWEEQYRQMMMEAEATGTLKKKKIFN